MKRTARLALRNRDTIAAALRDVLPASGRVLEVGSGTGEHVVRLAALFPALEWQPSDPDAEARASIAAWSREARLPNLRPPLDLDVRLPAFAARRADAILCVNVLHVSPPECGDALLAAAPRILPPGGPLVVYGPFWRRGAPLAGRLARLDAELRAHLPVLGVRELDGFAEAARSRGLAVESTRDMVEEGDVLVVLRRQPWPAPADDTGGAAP